MRDDDREQQTLFSGPGGVCTLNCSDKDQLADVSSSIFVDLSAIELANLASKGAIFVRGGVLKSTLVVDNDRQCTMYIHTQLPSVPQS